MFERCYVDITVSRDSPSVNIRRTARGYSFHENSQFLNPVDESHSHAENADAQTVFT